MTSAELSILVDVIRRNFLHHSADIRTKWIGFLKYFDSKLPWFKAISVNENSWISSNNVLEVEALFPPQRTALSIIIKDTSKPVNKNYSSDSSILINGCNLEIYAWSAFIVREARGGGDPAWNNSIQFAFRQPGEMGKERTWSWHRRDKSPSSPTLAQFTSGKFS